MNERDFLRKLEERASEQEKLIKRMPLRNVFVTSSLWLGEHPWRFMIPFSFLLTAVFRSLLSHDYYELVLAIFGGFGGLR